MSMLMSAGLIALRGALFGVCWFAFGLTLGQASKIYGPWRRRGRDSGKQIMVVEVGCMVNGVGVHFQLGIDPARDEFPVIGLMDRRGVHVVTRC